MYIGSGTSIKLPFRYLGVPISARRVTVAECHGLVEKMCARIKVTAGEFSVT